jgi:putative solute:sodium symporter small subunit
VRRAARRGRGLDRRTRSERPGIAEMPRDHEPSGRFGPAAFPCLEAKAMADLTHEQRESYWKYNIRLTAILLIIWFVVTYLLGGIFAGALNKIVILGFPLGYYIAAQGALIVFVVEIAIYAKLMNKKDLEYGIREEA